MRVNGYYIGVEPLSSEWKAYGAVKAFSEREFVATWLGPGYSEEVFEAIVDEFSRLQMDTAFARRADFEMACANVLERRRRFDSQ